MHVQHLAIETTRRCQLGCLHCLRGDTQQLDMNPNHLLDFLRPITSIDQVTFTGGEPFLNPSCIEVFINICRRRDIDVGNFYAVTNGLIFNEYSQRSERAVMQIARLFAFCTDNELSGIDISRTQFHETEITHDNLLHAFKFVGKREEIMEAGIILEGRAEKQGFAGRFLGDTGENGEVNWDEPYDNHFYLNCKGAVVLGCDFSYENQDGLSMTIEEAHKILKKLDEDV